MNRKVFWIIIPLFLVTIGYNRYIDFLGNNRAIEYSKEKLKNEKVYFLQLIELIKKMNIKSSSYTIIYYSKRSQVLCEDLSSNKEIKIEKLIFYHKIYKLVRKLRVRVKVVSGTFISFNTGKNNLTGNSYIKILYRLNPMVPLEEQYPNFEILKNNQRPSKYNKWIYIIDRDWYIIVD